jgi:hypothetical protein
MRNWFQTLLQFQLAPLHLGPCGAAPGVGVVEQEVFFRTVLRRALLAEAYTRPLLRST